MFNARDWLKTKGIAAQNLPNETWESVAGFTILWSLFEDKLCKGGACIKAFEELAGRVESNDIPKEIQAAYDFWQHRYIEDSATNFQFDDLFRHNKGEDIVRDSFLDNTATNYQRFLSVLIVVYRLRNNLFHGNKKVETLDGQHDNFDFATQALASVMDYLGLPPAE